MNQQRLPRGGNHLEKGTKMKAINDTQTTIQNVNVKIDPVVKESAESVLANMGLNMSAYIGMCLRQIAQDREIPFTQKADPGFWANEYRVYKTKRIVDSGILHPTFALYTEITALVSALGLTIATGLLSAESSGANPEIIGLANNILGSVKFGKSLSAVHASLFIYSELASTLEKSFADGKDAMPFTVYKEAFKSIDEEILDKCFKIVENRGADFFKLYSTVFDLDETERDITREDSVIYVDQLFNYAVETYNENPESIMQRYTGQVGGSGKAYLLFSASNAQDTLLSQSLNIKYEHNAGDTPLPYSKNKGGEQND